MQICPKKYEEVFQQLNQYKGFCSQYGQKYTKKLRVRIERFKNLMSEIFHNYMNLFSQVWSRKLLCLFYS